MITETVLEMHFHKPVMDLFRETLGLGDAGQVNFYKYSQQRECFIGFDQAYVRTELSERELFALLSDAAGSGYKLGEKFFGYFLQFKVVKEMQKRTKKYTPALINNLPHYRVSLDTKKNLSTGVSQHELLYNLNQKNAGAMVYYACPMIFDRAALYDIEVDLDVLRLADFDACPSAHTDNDNHFIFFDSPQGQPVWCSEPVQGKALTPREFVSAAVAQLGEIRPQQSAENLIKLLTNTEAAGISPEAELVQSRPTPNILSLVAESLTIVRVSSGETAQQSVAGDVSAVVETRHRSLVATGPWQ